MLQHITGIRKGYNDAQPFHLAKAAAHPLGRHQGRCRISNGVVSVMETKMGDSLKLSQPFDSVELAVKAGFKKVMANNNQQETKEFGFWVIMKVRDDKKGVQYFYTDPSGQDSGGEVELTLPVGQMVRAHCHTHPKRISTGNFSTGDKRSFVKLREARPSIAWYLLNPQSEIRRANDEKDFPAGVTVPW
jgi:hypothetical protein